MSWKIAALAIGIGMGIIATEVHSQSDKPSCIIIPYSDDTWEGTCTFNLGFILADLHEDLELKNDEKITYGEYIEDLNKSYALLNRKVEHIFSRNGFMNVNIRGFYALDVNKDCVISKKDDINEDNMIDQQDYDALNKVNSGKGNCDYVS